MMDGLVSRFEDRPLAVRTRGLSKRYGGRSALADLDLAVPEGAVYVLVGPNGAGKTTSLRALLDLVRPDAGEAEVFGVSAREEGAWVRAQIGYVPDSHEIGLLRTPVRDLLAHHRRYFPAWDVAYENRLVRELDLDPGAAYGKLSKGQARRVQLTMALAHRPALLLLDEPTDGLDPLARDQFFALLADHLAASPTTVLVSTHLVHEVEGLGDVLGVLRSGRLVAQVGRDLLSRRLLRVRASLPEDWREPARPPHVVVDQRSGRELARVAWGDEAEIRQALGTSGATVHECRSLSLEEATRALLRMEVA